MTTAQATWTGKVIGDFILEDLIGEGGFSWVYKASHRDGRWLKAFKIAKPSELTSSMSPAATYPTQALAFITGGVTDVRPDAAQLLAFQSEKLKLGAGPGVVQVDETVFDESICCSKMELIEGQTLRDLIRAGPVPITIFLQIARTLERLSKVAGFEYHGDLKPENIMVANSQVKVLDPGHFGPLDCQEGNLELCVVTTPSYYPYLTANDLLALGIMLWESACDQHPLDGDTDSGSMDLEAVGDELVRTVQHKELVGQYFLTPILAAKRPMEIKPDLSLETEKLLLKALQLQILGDGRLEKDRGFQNFSELIDDLQRLEQTGVKDL